jgi:hypothetical protein
VKHKAANDVDAEVRGPRFAGRVATRSRDGRSFDATPRLLGDWRYGRRRRCSS